MRFLTVRKRIRRSEGAYESLAALADLFLSFYNISSSSYRCVSIKRRNIYILILFF